MMELIHASFSGVNIIPTILLLVVALYWVTVFIGVLDMSFLDFDLDVDADVDMDLDLDLDADADLDVDADADADIHGEGDVSGHGPGGVLQNVLLFLNVGSVPFMVLLSFFALFFWMGSLLLNFYVAKGSLIISLGIIIPLMLVSLLVTKIVSAPFAHIFRKMNDEAKIVDLTGKLCTIIIDADEVSMGQAMLTVNDGQVLIKVKNHVPGVIKKGEQAIILEKDELKEVYNVELFNN